MIDFKNLHSYLYGSLVLFLVVSTISVASFAYSYATKDNMENYRTFSVSAEGKVVASPDIAQFTFSFLTEGTDVAKLEELNAEKNKLIVDKLNNFKVDSDDIKTEFYSVEPKYQYFQCNDSGVCPPAKIVGYTLSQSTSVKVRDLSSAGKILTEVSKLKVDNVSQLQFVIDDKTHYENVAREEAIKLASKKAKLTAKAAGFRIGKISSISESMIPFYNNMGMVAGNLKNMELDAAVSDSTEMAMVSAEISPGTEEVAITVNITYFIK
jgi:uncharacterized protein YggE